MPTYIVIPLTGRYPSFVELGDIAWCKAQRGGVHKVARAAGTDLR
ncbi:hypothetical protein [Rhodococcus xishaensis]|nr:hypothetical protein [Rhodococcus xishaensis]